MKQKIDYENVMKESLASMMTPELLFGKNGLIHEMPDFDIVFKDYLKKKKRIEEFRRMILNDI